MQKILYSLYWLFFFLFFFWKSSLKLKYNIFIRFFRHFFTLLFELGKFFSLILLITFILNSWFHFFTNFLFKFVLVKFSNIIIINIIINIFIVFYSSKKQIVKPSNNLGVLCKQLFRQNIYRDVFRCYSIEIILIIKQNWSTTNYVTMLYLINNL